MFVCIIEKRFSSKVSHKGNKKQELDWFALVACVLPFAPSEGTQVHSEPVPVRFNSVTYDPRDGVFYARVLEVVHPKHNAKTAAEELVRNHRWDIAVERSTLDEARKKLAAQAMSKLKSTILRARPFGIADGVGIGMGGPVKL